MYVRTCDVVGCREPAYWVRVSHVNTNHGRDLCQRCWSRLRAMSPAQAHCYSPKDDPEGATFAYSCADRSALHLVMEETDVIG